MPVTKKPITFPPTESLTREESQLVHAYRSLPRQTQTALLVLASELLSADDSRRAGSSAAFDRIDDSPKGCSQKMQTERTGVSRLDDVVKRLADAVGMPDLARIMSECSQWDELLRRVRRAHHAGRALPPDKFSRIHERLEQRLAFAPALLNDFAAVSDSYVADAVVSTEAAFLIGLELGRRGRAVSTTCAPHARDSRDGAR